MAELLGAIDQGTTNTRFIVFDGDGAVVGCHQVQHEQSFPRPGWVEHDPAELWQCTEEAVSVTMARAGISASDLAAIGIANQRETTVVWDRATGNPLCPAVVWQDVRTAPQAAALERDGMAALVRERTGLMPATYFSGLKLAWVLDNVGGVRRAAERGDALFGTVDTWLVWNLTGGLHVTDVTNASRTMLMDLQSLDWDQEILELLRIPPAMLPDIRPSTDSSGAVRTSPVGPFGGAVPLTAVLGDQHAAMVGQACFRRGETKCTYGTGSFVLMNTGASPVRSSHGLLTTVCYQLDGHAPQFALEGSVAASGAGVQWLRDQLGVLGSVAESEPLASEVPDSEGLYFVPAFSGLFAPYWRPDARGVLVGISRSHTKAHLARAALEAIAYQTLDLVEAMASDGGTTITELRADGGVTANDLGMQVQADVLGVPVVRPVVAETTALGAAYAAGLAVGLFSGTDEIRSLWKQGRRRVPSWDEPRRAAGYAGWKKAVQRTFDWDAGAGPAVPAPSAAVPS